MIRQDQDTGSDPFLLSLKTKDRREVMQKGTLGNSGLEVSALGFGCIGPQRRLRSAGGDRYSEQMQPLIN